MDYTYTFKVLDREEAEGFEKLVNILLDQVGVTVKTEIPKEGRMTSLVFVTIRNKTVRKYETLSIIAEVMHAKLVEIKEESCPN